MMMLYPFSPIVVGEFKVMVVIREAKSGFVDAFANGVELSCQSLKFSSEGNAGASHGQVI